MHRLFCALTCVAFAAACGGGSSSSDDDDDGGHADAPRGHDSSGGGDVAPEAGTWHYDQVTPTSNTCGTTLDKTDTGDYTIAAVTASGFTVITDSGSFACTLSATGFDCPDRAYGVYDAHPQADATFTGHATASGAFSDSTDGSGTQQANVSCAGADCATAEAALGVTLPCTLVVDFGTSRLDS